MPFNLAIRFPTEAEALRKQVHAERHLTPIQRLQAVVDTLAAAEALSQAGTVREAQLAYQKSLEDDWQCRMKEFIKSHVAQ